MIWIDFIQESDSLKKSPLYTCTDPVTLQKDARLEPGAAVPFMCATSELYHIFNTHKITCCSSPKCAPPSFFLTVWLLKRLNNFKGLSAGTPGKLQGVKCTYRNAHAISSPPSSQWVGGVWYTWWSNCTLWTWYTQHKIRKKPDKKNLNNEAYLIP